MGKRRAPMVYYTIMGKHTVGRLRMIKIVAALVFGGLCFLSACTAEPDSSGGTRTPPGERATVESGVLQFASPAEGDTIAHIVTSEGTIKAVLYGRQAPLAAENFTGLAKRGYYDENQFHRVAEDFVIQGGAAPLPEGADEEHELGDLDESIWGIPFHSEFSGQLHHYAGALCMAADGGADTHESQFYIVAAPAGNLDEAALEKLREAGYSEDVIEAYRQAGGLPYLDNTDTVFGQVFEGMEVVDAIAAAAADEEGKPRREVRIESVRIVEYEPAAESSSG